MNPDKTGNTNTRSNLNELKKPPLPFGLGTIARNYATLNKLMHGVSGGGGDSSSSSSLASSSYSYSNRSSQLEVPSAAATNFYTSSPYSSPSTLSMPYGSMISSSSSNRKLNTKSSSPILFRRTENNKHGESNHSNDSSDRLISEKFRLKKENLEKKPSLPMSSTTSLLVSGNREQENLTRRKKKYSTFSASASFLQKKRHSIESLIGFCKIYYKCPFLIANPFAVVN